MKLINTKERQHHKEKNRKKDEIGSLSFMALTVSLLLFLEPGAPVDKCSALLNLLFSQTGCVEAGELPVVTIWE